MKDSEKKLDGIPSPAQNMPDESLHRIMDDLGMETKSKAERQRYHRAVKARHLAPKVFIFSLIGLAVLLAVLLVTAPPELRQCTVQEGPSQWRLEIRTNRFMLMGGVTAKLDGRPIDVSRSGPGAYSVTADRNGQLTVTARSMMGREAAETFTVSSIDETAPRILDEGLQEEYRVGDELVLYLEDEGGAGIDWDSVAVTDLETGAPCPDVELDPEESAVRFPLPGSSVTITAADNNGNHLAVVLRIV